QLLSLLEAGLNLVEAIEALAENEPDPEVQAVMRRILENLYAGRTCSDAMEMQPEHFPVFYVATLRASERSGGTAESLRRYIAYQTQIDAVKKKVTSAMIYPLLLVVVGALVTLFLLGYVVPKFSRIYEDRATDLPFLSRALMQWGALVAGHGGKLFAALALGIWAAIWAVTRAATRQWIGHRLWAMPWLGERMRIYQLATLYRTLGMLLRGGTTIVGALALVPGLLSPVLRGRLSEAESHVREGQSISAAMLAAGLTTPVASRMLQVGERTGRMGEMMERVASFYDDEIARWLDVFTKVFEPVLMALIGVLVGGIVVLMYLPIFELAGSIQS
ncbi:MAG: type II secretion system F family protein, partial [Betaproteobacteria bacterium]|nr:type II secretion system F family protein [Betaproteobacteria bacterium]